MWLFRNFLFFLPIFSFCDNNSELCIKKIHEIKSEKNITNLIDLSQTFGLILKEIAQDQQKDINLHKIANVRLSGNLGPEEQNFLMNRNFFVHEKLEKLTKQKVDKQSQPRIALCFSGGSNRALIGTLATLKSAQEVGLLDITTYLASTSGSTWSLALWNASRNNLDECVNSIRTQIRHSLGKNFNLNSTLISALSSMIYKQTFSVVNIWGTLLGNRLLRLQNHKLSTLRLSETKNNFEYGLLPLPIYTAAMVEPDNDYDWIEFTPYEIGSAKAQTFVPAWSFNRPFKYGKSTEYSPEPNLDLYLGIWGSAFSANIEEALNHYSNKLPSFLYKKLNSIINSNYDLANYRFSPAKIKNIAYKISGHPWAKKKHITLVDAGLSTNLPLIPLIRKERAIDIIIICDFSDGLEHAMELQKSVKYAQSEGYNIPNFNTYDLHKKQLTIFENTYNPAVPTIIYMPCIKNENYSNFDPIQCVRQNSYCESFNLKYNNEQFDEYYGLARFNMLEQWKYIKKIIKNNIFRKSK